MDLQMPVMDGITATKEIRKTFSQDELPIVAMTAAAMNNDIKECLNAGMNDHISKPFEVEELIAKLKKWINFVSINDDNQNTATEIVGIDTKKLLSIVGNNMELAKDILRQFQKTFIDYIDNIESLLKDKNIVEAKKLLHTLKGSSGNICATNLYNETKECEKHLIDGNIPDLSNLKKIHFALINSISSLDTIDANNGTFDKENALKLIENFDDKLSHSSAIKQKDMDSFKNILGNYIDRDEFKNFERAVNNFLHKDAREFLMILKDVIETKDI
jgi:CheY-like chemotaxis protein